VAFEFSSLNVSKRGDGEGGLHKRRRRTQRPLVLEGSLVVREVEKRASAIGSETAVSSTVSSTLKKEAGRASVVPVVTFW
jgi:hypothetical protein